MLETGIQLWNIVDTCCFFLEWQMLSWPLVNFSFSFCNTSMLSNRHSRKPHFYVTFALIRRNWSVSQERLHKADWDGNRDGGRTFSCCHRGGVSWGDLLPACLLDPCLSAGQVYREHEPPPHLPSCHFLRPPSLQLQREGLSHAKEAWCKATQPSQRSQHQLPLAQRGWMGWGGTWERGGEGSQRREKDTHC